MERLRWKGAWACAVLLLATACVEPLTNPPAELPPETVGEDSVSEVETFEDLGAEDIGPAGDVEPEDIGPTEDLGPVDPPTSAPQVQGEPSAGHPHPTWLWTVPEGAASFRLRLDGGDWTPVDVEVTAYTAAEPLAAGAHLFEVQALNADGLTSPSGSFETTVKYFERPGYWDGVARDVAVAPSGNLAAISAHNCYLAFIDGPTSLEATRTMIQEAVAGGADLIELDIKEEGGLIYVDHDDDGTVDGALLADVLDLPELTDTDQIVYIEIKETETTVAFVADLLDLLDARREHYARNGRPVVLRTFLSKFDNVDLARDLLGSGAYPLIAPYVRLSVLFSKNDYPGLVVFNEKITELAEDGFGMVEFQYQSRNLMAKVGQAHSLGMGVNLWTIPSALGSVFISALRDQVDALTTDLLVATARSAVKDENILVRLDASAQAADAASMEWTQADGVPALAGINGPGQPTGASWGVDESLFGTVLAFDPDAAQFLPFGDVDCAPDGGLLVTASVRFDRLALEDGETMVLIAKSDMAGWTLELHEPPGMDPAELRFGVFVDDGYHYAAVPADWVLDESDGFFIIGAYNGNGPVRLWVNNDADAVLSDEVTGGVVNNDSQLLLGADPQGDAPPRYFFDGVIQQVTVLHW